MRVKTAYCLMCEKRVKVEAKDTNHILHLLLSVITAGLWVVVWLLCAISRDWRCAECGTKKVKKIR